MSRENESLRAKAEDLLLDIEYGEAWPEELADNIGEFSGYKIESLRSKFIDIVIDMRDYGEADHEDWNEFLKSIPSSRHATLILHPSEITRSELARWALSDETDSSDSVCSAAAVPLDDRKDGAVAVIGLQGQNIDYEIFLVAASKRDAEKLWEDGWI